MCVFVYLCVLCVGVGGRVFHIVTWGAYCPGEVSYFDMSMTGRPVTQTETGANHTHNRSGKGKEEVFFRSYDLLQWTTLIFE
jgi:hypothetical protein